MPRSGANSGSCWEFADRTQANLEDHEYSRHSERTQRKFAYMIRTGGFIHHTHKTKDFR
jgi:hypothetical protein